MTEQDGGQRFWRVQARRYDRAIELLNRRFHAMTEHVAAAVGDSDEVLEIGAGTGIVTLQVAPVVGRVVATDRSSEMLEILRGRLAEANATNVDVEVADALALTYADESFDAVIMANLLHLLPEPAAALAEARRVLRRPGLLCAPTFCHGETWNARLVSYGLGLARFPVRTRFSGDELRTTIEVAGFEVVKATKYPGLLPLWLMVAKPM